MRLTYSSELASSDKRNHYATSRFESAGKPVTKVNINITSIVKYLLSQSYHIIPLLKHNGLLSSKIPLFIMSNEKCSRQTLPVNSELPVKH